MISAKNWKRSNYFHLIHVKLIQRVGCIMLTDIILHTYLVSRSPVLKIKELEQMI